MNAPACDVADHALAASIAAMRLDDGTVVHTALVGLRLRSSRRRRKRDESDPEAIPLADRRSLTIGKRSRAKDRRSSTIPDRAILPDRRSLTIQDRATLLDRR
jgi:hypothetical protein